VSSMTALPLRNVLIHSLHPVGVHDDLLEEAVGSDRGRGRC